MIKYLTVILLIGCSHTPPQTNPKMDIVQASFESTYYELLKPYPAIDKEDFIFISEPLNTNFYKDLQIDSIDEILTEFKAVNAKTSNLGRLIPDFINRKEQLDYLNFLKSNKTTEFWPTLANSDDYFGIIKMTEPVILSGVAFVVLSFQWGPRNGFVQWFQFKKRGDTWVVVKSEITIEY